MAQAQGDRLSPFGVGSHGIATTGQSSRILAAPLPARWGRLQRWKNTLIYLAIRAAFASVRLVPFVLANACAPLLGSLAYVVAGGTRRRMVRHLGVAFPNLVAREHRRIARQCLIHLSRAGLEAAHLRRFTHGARAVRLTEEQQQLWREALAQGRGVVAVTGHIGNWELLAQAVAASFETATIAKPLYDPRLTRWVHRLRTAGGLQLIWRGEPSGAREMLRSFREGRVLALLIDQDTDVPGCFVPFFGRPAYTPTVAATLALRSGAPVIVGWIHREGSDHRLAFERVDYDTSGASDDREGDVAALTARITAVLEGAIRSAPEQWVWMHERWRRTPE